ARLVLTRATTSPRPAAACTSPTHAHGLIVLTLADDKICAITRFGDNSLLATSRDHRISPIGYAVDGHRARWPHIDPAIACNDSDTELSSQGAPRRSGLTSPDPVAAPVS